MLFSCLYNGEFVCFIFSSRKMQLEFVNKATSRIVCLKAESWLQHKLLGTQPWICELSLFVAEHTTVTDEK